MTIYPGKMLPGLPRLSFYLAMGPYVHRFYNAPINVFPRGGGGVKGRDYHRELDIFEKLGSTSLPM